MDTSFASLIGGISVAGIIFGIIITAILVMRIRNVERLILPLCYCLSLIAGFLVPLLHSGGDDFLTLPMLRTMAAALPAIGYLFIIQLLNDDLPKTVHFLALIFPLVALVGLTIAVPFGGDPICPFSNDPSNCIDILAVLNLYDVLTGAVLLLILMLVIRTPMESIEELALGREKRALVLTIIGLTVMLLGFNLLLMFEIITLTQTQMISIVLRLTFFYLIASSIFRVFPSAFSLPEPELPEREQKRLTERKSLTSEEEDQLKRIEELMNLDKLYQEAQFSRKQLADELNIPEHQLSRIINTGLGKSFTDLINHHRVQEAKQLLRDTDDPISQIAFDVGFNSLASFNRVFKTSANVSPSAYRRESQDSAKSGDAEAPGTAEAN